MWPWIAGVLLLPVVVNLLLWRKDLRRLRQLAPFRKEVSPRDLLRHGEEGVSFLVAAWNEEATLEPCIEAILALDYPHLEIVLCAGGTDRTWQIASQFRDPRLIVIAQQPGEGKQRALQRCLQAASGEIIYLLDAGCIMNGPAFARILNPILSRKEQAVTSTPCIPIPQQLAIPFVVSQCAGRIYTSIHQPDYCSGLFGASTAIRREALERAGGFDGAVRTGGDYDLGKRLRQQGIRIRYEFGASIPIEFHTLVTPYIRQQARWLRNVVIHGVRFHAYREVISCLATSLVGFAMLVLPLAVVLSSALDLSPAFVRAAATAWGFGFLHALLSRLRYWSVGALWLGVPFSHRSAALLPLFLLLDFLVWSVPLFQYPFRSWRESW